MSTPGERRSTRKYEIPLRQVHQDQASQTDCELAVVRPRRPLATEDPFIAVEFGLHRERCEVRSSTGFGKLAPAFFVVDDRRQEAETLFGTEREQWWCRLWSPGVEASEVGGPITSSMALACSTVRSRSPYATGQVATAIESAKVGYQAS